MFTQPTSDPGSDRDARTRPTHLPVTRALTLIQWISYLIALLAAAVAMAGLGSGASLYQSEEMLLLKVPTDLFTLIIAVPLLLISIWLARHGRLLGLLCWPAPLLYLLYIYVANAIGVPLGILFLPYVAIAALSGYTLIGLIACIDAGTVRRRLADAVPARPSGVILVALSILFSLMNVAYVITALTNPAPGHPLEMPVWIADFVVLAPAWILGGLLLWRRNALGYVAGAALLLVGCMLFLGAIFSLVYAALYTGAPLDLAGVVIMLVASLVCVVPSALYVRGILQSNLDALPR